MKFDLVPPRHVPLAFMAPYLKHDMVCTNIGRLRTCSGWFRMYSMCYREKLTDDLRNRIVALATFYVQLVRTIGEHSLLSVPAGVDKLMDVRDFLWELGIEPDDGHIVRTLETMGFCKGDITKKYNVQHTGTFNPFSWMMRGKPQLLRVRANPTLFALPHGLSF